MHETINITPLNITYLISYLFLYTHYLLPGTRTVDPCYSRSVPAARWRLVRAAESQSYVEERERIAECGSGLALPGSRALSKDVTGRGISSSIMEC